MVCRLKVLDSVPSRAISAASQRRAHHANPYIFLVITLVTPDLGCRLSHHVRLLLLLNFLEILDFYQHSSLNFAYFALLRQIRPSTFINKLVSCILQFLRDDLGVTV